MAKLIILHKALVIIRCKMKFNITDTAFAQNHIPLPLLYCNMKKMLCLKRNFYRLNQFLCHRIICANLRFQILCLFY
jgi:hypothetical protein